MDEKKQELNDFLLSLARKYGLSVSELKNLAVEVAQELENKSIKPKIKVGWYAFEGAKFSPNPKAYPNCQGVVGWLNPNPNAPIGQRGLILTPDEFSSTYADRYSKAGSNSENDGKSNTRKMVLCARDNGVVSSAAIWCYSYSKDGVRIGEAFFPAKNQLKQLVANRLIINPALERIDGDILDGLYVSSSECDELGVWGVNTNCAQDDILIDKVNEFVNIRSVIAF